MAGDQGVLGKFPLTAATIEFLKQGKLGHYIDGQDVPSLSGDSFPVIAPDTGEVFAHVSAGDSADVDRAVRSARAAYEDGRWHARAPKEREAILRRLARLFEENRDVLTDLDMLDGGTTRRFSDFMVQFSIDIINYYAGWPTKIQGGIPATSSQYLTLEVREPLGVCAVIFPWNGPSGMPLGLLPPLACGNSVVFKPAEQTPLSALFIARLCTEAGVPAGVVNVVQGTGEKAGAPLTEHPQVDMISFTGSVETGRRIQKAAGEQMKKVALELGGKSPHIIFGDADLEAAAVTAAAAVWGHSGQICMAGTRILVQRNVHDAFVEKLVDATRQFKIGSAFDSDTHIGPVISEQQLARIRRYVEIGRQERGKVAFGGELCGEGGYFHQPTIFTNISNDMTIAREEIFGPVAVVIPFEDEEQACAIANDSDFGLAAGLWTRDLDRAHRVSRRLRAGSIWVNSYLLVDPAMSYGGLKQSGVGRSLGHASIEEFTQVRTIWFHIGG